MGSVEDEVNQQRVDALVEAEGEILRDDQVIDALIAHVIHLTSVVIVLAPKGKKGVTELAQALVPGGNQLMAYAVSRELDRARQPGVNGSDTSQSQSKGVDNGEEHSADRMGEEVGGQNGGIDR